MEGGSLGATLCTDAGGGGESVGYGHCQISTRLAAALALYSKWDNDLMHL